MKKIFVRILFFLQYFFRKIVGKFFNLIIWRSKKIILFSGRIGAADEKFIHSTKYLFLFLNHINNCGYKTVWLCDKENLRNHLLKSGYKNVFPRKSFWGRYYSLKAKYIVTDYFATDIVENPFMLEGTICIDFWHGIPLKKIIYDDNERWMKIDLNKLTHKLWNIMRPKEDYFIVNGEFEQKCYTTAFVMPKEKIKIIGSPRIDVLLHDFPNEDLCMEQDFENIRKLKTSGKKIFIYMPTFRDSGKDISGWLKSDKLHKFLQDNNTVLVCKLHPNDDNSLDFDYKDNSFYKMDHKSDIYPILKYSDALITDYSSVYYDYLLLDKPILYYPIDLEEYEASRGFYEPYEILTAGIKADNEEELINAMSDVINGKDNYKEKRKALCDRMFKYKDGHNCERVIDWIKTLD